MLAEQAEALARGFPSSRYRCETIRSALSLPIARMKSMIWSHSVSYCATSASVDLFSFSIVASIQVVLGTP